MATAGARARASDIPDPATATLHVYAASTSLAASVVPNARKLWVRCLGGGGAGGGAPATTAAQNSVGGGGQAGCYAETILTVASLTFPLQINVGAGGVATTAAGGDGGTTSVVDAGGAGSVLCSAMGGQGGSVATGPAGTSCAGGRANTATLGVITGVGAPGFPGMVFVFEYPSPGYGGNSILGGGGSVLSGLGNLQAQGGLSYGAGGAGSSRRASQTALNGANGVIGAVFVMALY